MTFDWDEFKTMSMVMGKTQDMDTLQLVFGTWVCDAVLLSKLH